MFEVKEKKQMQWLERKGDKGENEKKNMDGKERFQNINKSILVDPRKTPN